MCDARQYVRFPPTGLNSESAVKNGREKIGGASPGGTEPKREKIVWGVRGGGYGLMGAP